MATQFYPYWLYGARPVVLLTKLCLFSEVVSNMLVTLMFQDLLWHPSATTMKQTHDHRVSRQACYPLCYWGS